MEKLDKGLLDFGILLEPNDIKKFDCLPIPYTDNLGILMRKDSPLAEKDSITANDLFGIPIIAPYSIMNYNNFLKWMGNNLEKLNIVAFSNLIFNASLLVEEGSNYAICVNDLVNTTGNSNLCFKPFEPNITLSSVLVWKKYQVFSKASQKFLNELKKELDTKN